MKKGIQKQIGASVGLQPNFFNDIIHERAKCPPAYALKLAPLTGISLEIWIDPNPEGKRRAAWKQFVNDGENAAHQ